MPEETTETTTEEAPKKTRNRKPPSPQKKALAVGDKVRELTNRRFEAREKFVARDGEFESQANELINSLTDEEREILFRVSPELKP